MLLDVIFPPACLICRCRVELHGTLCLGCWKQVHFITEPFCACCGLPFDYSLGENAMCGECIQERPLFSRARAAFKYDEHSSKLVTALKYSDQTQLATTYGKWLTSAGKALIAASEVIVPVPLHWRRFLSRRYNQSALLAAALAKETGLIYVPDALKRTRHTLPQTGLTRAQRQENVRGAFSANPLRIETIKGKSILLIDDVMTTAATLDQCSRMLLKNGAAYVNVITLARKI